MPLVKISHGSFTLSRRVQRLVKAAYKGKCGVLVYDLTAGLKHVQIWIGEKDSIVVQVSEHSFDFKVDPKVDQTQAVLHWIKKAGGK